MPSAIAALATAGVRLERDSLYCEVLALATSAARRRERGQAPPPSPTRTSKRLRLSSKEALIARIDAARKRQENAHFHLLEMVSSKQRPLSLARLRAVLKDLSEDGTLDLNRVNYINSSTVSGGRCVLRAACRVPRAARCSPRGLSYVLCTSPRLASPRLASPRLASPRLVAVPHLNAHYPATTPQVPRGRLPFSSRGRGGHTQMHEGPGLAWGQSE